MLSGIDHLGLFVLAGLLLNLTPGPDVLYIVSQGLRGGWRGGAVAAFGISAGCFVHIGAATLGISALIAASATAFTVLKWIGAAYLLYVGVGLLFAASKGRAARLTTRADQPVVVGGSLGRVFMQGFWTNTLNPKVALFFLAFLPQFIRPDAPDATLSFLLLGLIFNLNGLPVNLGYGLGAAWLSRRLQRAQRGVAWLERGAGALFIAFGIRLAISENTTH